VRNEQLTAPTVFGDVDALYNSKPKFAAMEVKLTDSAKDHVEVTIKMPARLHDHLASICSRSDVKLDDIVCEQIERWLLRQTITRLEAPEEDKGRSTGGGASEGRRSTVPSGV
jgi:hypothetical protein